MLSVGGAFAELATSGDVISRLGGRGLLRAAIRVVVAVIAGLGEEWPFLTLITIWPLSLLHSFQQFIMLALTVLHLYFRLCTL